VKGLGIHRSIAMAALLLLNPFTVSAALPTGTEIVQHCYYKNEGNDQRSRLLVTSTLANGKKTTSEYLRLWKNYFGEKGIVDKVVLYTTSPHNRGLAFMRWGYINGSEKLADQWVYLPELRTMKRISKRSPDEMDWGFSDDDLRVRDIDEDVHRLVEIRVHEGNEFYIVESLPRKDPIYGKRVSWFSKTDDWEQCLEKRTDYFDKEMKMVKKQTITWRLIDSAWVWETAIIKNYKANTLVVYDVRDIEVNVGLKNREFTQRALMRGYKRSR